MLFRGAGVAPFFSKKELEMKEIKKPETVYLKKDYVDERTGIKKLSNIIKCENCRVYQITNQNANAYNIANLKNYSNPLIRN